MPAYCFLQRTAGSPALRYSQTLQAPRPDCRLHPDSRLFRSLFCQRLPHSPDRRRMQVRSNFRRCCTLRFDTLHSRCCDFGAPPSADFPFPVLWLLLRPIPRLFLQVHSDLYPSAHNRGHNPALHCLYHPVTFCADGFCACDTGLCVSFSNLEKSTICCSSSWLF